MRWNRWIGILAALINFWVAQTVALAATPPCPETRKRSELVDQIASGPIKDLLLVSGAQTTQHQDIRRPVPEMSAIDYKRAWVKLLLPMIAPRDSSALFFTFYSSEHPSEDPEVINIPADVYWCLAAFGDSVLLSDGMNMHHYSNVASIDHEKQTVALIDHSPNLQIGRAHV